MSAGVGNKTIENSRSRKPRCSRWNFVSICFRRQSITTSGFGGCHLDFCTIHSCPISTDAGTQSEIHNTKRMSLTSTNFQNNGCLTGYLCWNFYDCHFRGRLSRAAACAADSRWLAAAAAPERAGHWGRCPGYFATATAATAFQHFSNYLETISRQNEKRLVVLLYSRITADDYIITDTQLVN